MALIYSTERVFADRCPTAIRMLSDAGHQLIISNQDLTFDPDQLSFELRNRIDGLIASGTPWTGRVFDLFPNLKVIVRFGVGVESFDMQAAKERGIKVCNARGGNARAVAEHTLGMTLALLRRSYLADAALRRGEWLRMLNTDLCGKTVGLIGFGAIAQHFARMLSGFEDVTILACRRSNHPFPEAEALHVNLVSEPELLAQSDIVSLHLPADAENYHKVNSAFLSAMKSGSYLINTSRGAVLDSTALLNAIHSGHLAGAAVDVYEVEPVSNHPFFQESRIFCTPHIAADTKEAADSVGQIVARELITALAGGIPANWLNR